VASAPLRAPVRVDKPLVERVVAVTRASLPVERWRRLGRVTVWNGRRVVGSRSLVAARPASAPSLAGKLGWYASRTAHHVAGWFT
jgi:hypothetical protein